MHLREKLIVGDNFFNKYIYFNTQNPLHGNDFLGTSTFFKNHLLFKNPFKLTTESQIVYCKPQPHLLFLCFFKP